MARRSSFGDDYFSAAIPVRKSDQNSERDQKSEQEFEFLARWQPLYAIRYDPHFTVEYFIIRELTATPVHPPLAFSLSIDGERNEPRRFVLFWEPPVSDHTLVVSPLAGKFVVL